MTAAADLHHAGLVFLGETLVLGGLLVSLAVIDVVSLRLPNVLTYPLIGIGLALAAPLGTDALISRLVGATAGFLVLFAVSRAYRALRGREGLGLGDAKLLAGAGAWLGWMPLPWVVLIGCVASLLGVAAMAILRRETVRAGRIPFGAGLALGLMTVWLLKPLGLW